MIGPWQSSKCADKLIKLALGNPRVNNIKRSYIPLAALGADMSLLSRVNDEVQSQLFLALEGLHADRADKRSVGIVALLVSSQVVLPLQSSATDVTEEPSTATNNSFFRTTQSIPKYVMF